MQAKSITSIGHIDELHWRWDKTGRQQGYRNTSKLLVLSIAGGTWNEEPVIHTAMFANREARSLICSGNVPQGSKIKFSLPQDADSMDTVVADCKGIKEKAQHQADALITFSCVSRYLLFGIVMKEELEQVQIIWDAPMPGFFSYGEYGNLK